MKTSAWMRRHALSIASQLPEDTAEALEMLGYVRDLVEFVARGSIEYDQGLRVLRFPGSGDAGDSSSA